MGMDVFGKNKDSEVGSYFRRNVWGWRPLAEMVTEMFPDLTAGCKYWQSNDGDGLDAAGSVALAKAINEAIADGRIAKYVRERDARLKALSKVECKICGGTGRRLWPDGVKECNACHGDKVVEPYDKWYSLDENDAKEFAAFLAECGGFEIC